MVQRMARFAWLIVLAACPAKNPPPQQPQPLAGPGCPAASDVYVASYVTQAEGKRSGWVMPLHAMKVEPSASTPDYQTVDATTATASGVPQPPAGNLWLVTGNAAPCALKLGGYYTARVEGPPAGLSYGIELEGCLAPSDQDSGGVVLVSQDAPTGCQFEAPHPVATRVGQMTDQKTWQKPAQGQPIPPAFAPVVPQHDCQAPSCEQLWAIAEVDVNNAPVVWSGAVNWLAIGDPAAACSWKAERFSGFFIPGADGKPTKVEAEHPLVLTAALVDRSGAHVLLAEGPGEYATYDLVPGKATLAHSITWMLAPNDAWDMVDHLGPICEPTPAAPAPLPKDAKPQSPY
jgi:hypothetical protein